MTHRPVGNGTSFAITTSSAVSVPLSVQTKAIRVVADQQNAHVAIGYSPTAAVTDYLIPAGTSATLALDTGTQVVSGISSGAITTVTFAEGTGTVFAVGDYVSFTSATVPGWNFTHQRVISVDNRASYDGSFSTGIGISFNSSVGFPASSPIDGVLRRSVKIAARTDTGTGTLYAQQVQVTGDA